MKKLDITPMFNVTEHIKLHGKKFFFAVLLSTTLQCSVPKSATSINSQENIYAQHFFADSKMERAKENYEHAISMCLTAIAYYPNEPAYYERLGECAKAYINMPVDSNKKNVLCQMVLKLLTQAAKKFPKNDYIKKLLTELKALYYKKT